MRRPFHRATDAHASRLLLTSPNPLAPAAIVVEEGAADYAVLALHALAVQAGLVRPESPVLQIAGVPDGYERLSRTMRRLLSTDRALRERAVRRGARSPDLVTSEVADPQRITIADATHARKQELLSRGQLILFGDRYSTFLADFPRAPRCVAHD